MTDWRKRLTKTSKISKVEFQQILDDAFNQLQYERDTNVFNEILTSIFSIPNEIIVTMINHRFFVQLRTNFVQILHRWNQKSQLKEVESFYFWNLNKLFRIFIQTTSINLDTLLNGIADRTFLKEIAEILTNLSTSMKFSDGHELKLLTNLLRNLNKCQIRLGRENSSKIDTFEILLQPIVQCLTSTNVIDSFLDLTKQSRKMNSKEKFYLVQLPNFLLSYQGNEKESIFNEYLSKIIAKYENLFRQSIASINQWSKSVYRALQQTFRLFHHACHDSLRNRQLMSHHSGLIDQILQIISSSSLREENATKKSNKKSKLVNIVLILLLSLSHEPTIIERIQERKLSEIFLQFQKSSNPILVQNSTALLAVTAREEDMKSIENPSNLLYNVVSSLKTDVDTSAQQSVEQNFQTLKSLVQHEQMKDEILKQNTIPFLLQCIDKVTEKALITLFETLWTLAFSSDAAKLLRKDQNFLSRIQTMSEKTHEEGLQKAIEGLVWKLIQEPAMLERISKREENQKQTITTSEVIIDENGEKKTVTKTIDQPAGERTFEYDIMISYCHADKELVYQVHEFLLEQGFKIWIDRNHMHGPAMSAMADAVENSEFVLMCMSESYKKSTYCQAEAEYAFNCKRRIVPLIVRPKYRADGWLGFLIGSRIYIDFGSFDFPTACQKLMNEMRLQRQRPLPSKPAPTNQETIPKKTEPVVIAPPPPIQVETKKLPTGLDQYKERKFQWNFQQQSVGQWTDADVLDFLASKQLHELMPLCEKMDGNALIQLYKMCTLQHDRTYSILDDELKDKFQMKLPISTYTRFLSYMDILRRSTAVSQPLQAPVLDSSYRPYDILVTSNAPPNQMLSMVQQILPQLPFKKQFALSH